VNYGLVERKAQGFLELFGSIAGISEKLDDRTIGNAYDKKEVAFIFRQIFEKSKTSDRILSGDGSGLETSRRQNYGKDKTTIKEFLTSIVDSREIVQAFDFSEKDEGIAMHSLIKEVAGIAREELEKRTGESVVSEENYLDVPEKMKKKRKKLLESSNFV